MGLDTAGILDQITSHALTLGIFDRVGVHEPKNAPGNGLSCAIWLDRLSPVRSSGLDAVSVRLAFNLRIYAPMLTEPQDDIDPAVLAATDTLVTAYCRDFDLGGKARHIDFFGSDGAGLDARAGYLQQDGAEYRVMVITLPIIVNDAWDEVA